MREWDLKISYREAELIQHAGMLSDVVRELDDRIAAATPGRQYLLAKKRDELMRDEITRIARAHARAVLDDLDGLGFSLQYFGP